MRRALRVLAASVRLGFAEMVAYRAEMVIWFLTATLPLVMMLVWDRVAEQGPVAGRGRAELAGWFAWALAVRQLSGAWVVWTLNADIRRGSLSPWLLRPAHPLLVHAGANLASMPYRLVVVVPLVAAIALWRPGSVVPPAPAEAALLLLSTFLAWLLHYVAQATIGCLAFHLGQSLGLWNLFFGLFALLSGYLFPLDALPAWAEAAARALPFQAMLALPVEIATGGRTGLDALAAVGVQLAWLAGALLLLRAAWRTGIRRYEAYGA